MRHYVRDVLSLGGEGRSCARTPHVLSADNPAQRRRLAAHRAVARPAALIVTYAARVRAAVAAGSAPTRRYEHHIVPARRL